MSCYILQHFFAAVVLAILLTWSSDGAPAKGTLNSSVRAQSAPTPGRTVGTKFFFYFCIRVSFRSQGVFSCINRLYECIYAPVTPIKKYIVPVGIFNII